MLDLVVDMLCTTILQSPQLFAAQYNELLTSNSTLSDHAKQYFSNILYHFAIQYNCVSAVETLLQNDVVPSTLDPIHFYTPISRLLISPPTSNTLPTLATLIKHGVSVNQIDTCLDQTPLLTLLSSPIPFTQVHVDILQLLLKNDAFCASPGDDNQLDEIPVEHQTDLQLTKPQFLPPYPLHQSPNRSDTVTVTSNTSNSTGNTHQSNHADHDPSINPLAAPAVFHQTFVYQNPLISLLLNPYQPPSQYYAAILSLLNREDDRTDHLFAPIPSNSPFPQSSHIINRFLIKAGVPRPYTPFTSIFQNSPRLPTVAKITAIKSTLDAIMNVSIPTCSKNPIQPKFLYSAMFIENPNQPLDGRFRFGSTLNRSSTTSTAVASTTHNSGQRGRTSTTQGLAPTAASGVSGELRTNDDLLGYPIGFRVLLEILRHHDLYSDNTIGLILDLFSEPSFRQQWYDNCGTKFYKSIKDLISNPANSPQLLDDIWRATTRDWLCISFLAMLSLPHTSKYIDDPFAERYFILNFIHHYEQQRLGLPSKLFTSQTAYPQINQSHLLDLETVFASRTSNHLSNQVTGSNTTSNPNNTNNNHNTTPQSPIATQDTNNINGNNPNIARYGRLSITASSMRQSYQPKAPGQSNTARQRLQSTHNPLQGPDTPQSPLAMTNQVKNPQQPQQQQQQQQPIHPINNSSNNSTHMTSHQLPLSPPNFNTNPSTFNTSTQLDHPSAANHQISANNPTKFDSSFGQMFPSTFDPLTLGVTSPMDNLVQVNDLIGNHNNIAIAQHSALTPFQQQNHVQQRQQEQQRQQQQQQIHIQQQTSGGNPNAPYPAQATRSPQSQPQSQPALNLDPSQVEQLLRFCDVKTKYSAIRAALLINNPTNPTQPPTHEEVCTQILIQLQNGSTILPLPLFGVVNEYLRFIKPWAHLFHLQPHHEYSSSQTPVRRYDTDFKRILTILILASCSPTLSLQPYATLESATQFTTIQTPSQPQKKSGFSISGLFHKDTFDTKKIAKDIRVRYLTMYMLLCKFPAPRVSVLIDLLYNIPMFTSKKSNKYDLFSSCTFPLILQHSNYPPRSLLAVFALHLNAGGWDTTTYTPTDLNPKTFLINELSHLPSPYSSTLNHHNHILSVQESPTYKSTSTGTFWNPHNEHTIKQILQLTKTSPAINGMFKQLFQFLNQTDQSLTRSLYSFFLLLDQRISLQQSRLHYDFTLKPRGGYHILSQWFFEGCLHTSSVAQAHKDSKFPPYFDFLLALRGHSAHLIEQPAATVRTVQGTSTPAQPLGFSSTGHSSTTLSLPGSTGTDDCLIESEKNDDFVFDHTTFGHLAMLSYTRNSSTDVTTFSGTYSIPGQQPSWLTHHNGFVPGSNLSTNVSQARSVVSSKQSFWSSSSQQQVLVNEDPVFRLHDVYGNHFYYYLTLNKQQRFDKQHQTLLFTNHVLLNQVMHSPAFLDILFRYFPAYITGFLRSIGFKKPSILSSAPTSSSPQASTPNTPTLTTAQQQSSPIQGILTFPHPPSPAQPDTITALASYHHFACTSTIFPESNPPDRISSTHHYTSTQLLPPALSSSPTIDQQLRQLKVPIHLNNTMNQFIDTLPKYTLTSPCVEVFIRSELTLATTISNIHFYSLTHHTLFSSPRINLLSSSSSVWKYSLYTVFIKLYQFGQHIWDFNETVARNVFDNYLGKAFASQLWSLVSERTDFFPVENHLKPPPDTALPQPQSPFKTPESLFNNHFDIMVDYYPNFPSSPHPVHSFPVFTAGHLDTDSPLSHLLTTAVAKSSKDKDKDKDGDRDSHFNKNSPYYDALFAADLAYIASRIHLEPILKIPTYPIHDAQNQQLHLVCQKSPSHRTGICEEFPHSSLHPAVTIMRTIHHHLAPKLVTQFSLHELIRSPLIKYSPPQSSPLSPSIHALLQFTGIPTFLVKSWDDVEEQLQRTKHYSPQIQRNSAVLYSLILVLTLYGFDIFSNPSWQWSQSLLLRFASTMTEYQLGFQLPVNSNTSVNNPTITNTTPSITTTTAATGTTATPSTTTTPPIPTSSPKEDKRRISGLNESLRIKHTPNTPPLGNSPLAALLPPLPTVLTNAFSSIPNPYLPQLLQDYSRVYFRSEFLLNFVNIPLPAHSLNIVEFVHHFIPNTGLWSYYGTLQLHSSPSQNKSGLLFVNLLGSPLPQQPQPSIRATSCSNHIFPLDNVNPLTLDYIPLFSRRWNAETAHLHPLSLMTLFFAFFNLHTYYLFKFYWYSEFYNSSSPNTPTERNGCDPPTSAANAQTSINKLFSTPADPTSSTFHRRYNLADTIDPNIDPTIPQQIYNIYELQGQLSPSLIPFQGITMLDVLKHLHHPNHTVCYSSSQDRLSSSLMSTIDPVSHENFPISPLQSNNQFKFPNESHGPEISTNGGKDAILSTTLVFTTKQSPIDSNPKQAPILPLLSQYQAEEHRDPHSSALSTSSLHRMNPDQFKSRYQHNRTSKTGEQTQLSGSSYLTNSIDNSSSLQPDSLGLGMQQSNIPGTDLANTSQNMADDTNSQSMVSDGNKSTDVGHFTVNHPHFTTNPALQHHHYDMYREYNPLPFQTSRDKIKQISSTHSRQQFSPLADVMGCLYYLFSFTQQPEVQQQHPQEPFNGQDMPIALELLPDMTSLPQGLSHNQDKLKPTVEEILFVERHNEWFTAIVYFILQHLDDSYTLAFLTNSLSFTPEDVILAFMSNCARPTIHSVRMILMVLDFFNFYFFYPYEQLAKSGASSYRSLKLIDILRLHGYSESDLNPLPTSRSDGQPLFLVASPTTLATILSRANLRDVMLLLTCDHSRYIPFSYDLLFISLSCGITVVDVYVRMDDVETSTCIQQLSKLDQFRLQFAQRLDKLVPALQQREAKIQKLAQILDSHPPPADLQAREQHLTELTDSYQKYQAKHSETLDQLTLIDDQQRALIDKILVQTNFFCFLFSLWEELDIPLQREHVLFVQHLLSLRGHIQFFPPQQPARIPVIQTEEQVDPETGEIVTVQYSAIGITQESLDLFQFQQQQVQIYIDQRFAEQFQTLIQLYSNSFQQIHHNASQRKAMKSILYLFNEGIIFP